MGSNKSFTLIGLVIMLFALSAIAFAQPETKGTIKLDETKKIAVLGTNWVATLKPIEIHRNTALVEIGFMYSVGEPRSENGAIYVICEESTPPCKFHATFEKYEDKIFHIYGTLYDDRIVIDPITLEKINEESSYNLVPISAIRHLAEADRDFFLV